MSRPGVDSGMGRIDHSIQIKYDAGSIQPWFAVCVCGWVSRYWRLQSDVMREVRDHGGAA
jgi:hypothetical protein